LIALSVTAVFADTREEPVGLVLSAAGSKLLRAGTETPLAARPGDLLFAGDGLQTESGPASFLFCPGKALDTLTPSGEVRLDAKAPKVRSGRITEQPARACTLPQTLRVADASRQHYGVSMTRGLNRMTSWPRMCKPSWRRMTRCWQPIQRIRRRWSPKPPYSRTTK
jgi:hypothetical protein